MISAARAQDWLNGALNPMIAGLREEQKTKSRLFWSPPGRFDYFYRLGDYAIDADNLEDLEQENPSALQVRLDHDQRLEALNAACADAFGSARTDPGLNAALSQLLSARGASGAPADHDRRYLLAYVCEGAHQLEPLNTFAALWLEHGPRLLATFATAFPEERARVDRDAALFRAQVDLALDSLKLLRHELAGKFGLRLKPVA